MRPGYKKKRKNDIRSGVVSGTLDSLSQCTPGEFCEIADAHIECHDTVVQPFACFKRILKHTALDMRLDKDPEMNTHLPARVLVPSM